MATSAANERDTATRILYQPTINLNARRSTPCPVNPASLKNAYSISDYLRREIFYMPPPPGLTACSYPSHTGMPTPAYLPAYRLSRSEGNWNALFRSPLQHRPNLQNGPRRGAPPADNGRRDITLHSMFCLLAGSISPPIHPHQQGKTRCSVPFNLHPKTSTRSLAWEIHALWIMETYY